MAGIVAAVLSSAAMRQRLDRLALIATGRLRPGTQDRVMGALRPVLWRGDNVECPICGGHFERFLPYWNRDYCRCPRCDSHERHRALWLYLQRRTDLLTARHELLHLAPEPSIAEHLRARPNLGYVSADLDSPLAMLHFDIQDIPFKAGTFDAVICGHVLTEVPDDRLAMREMKRVLQPGGWAIVMAAVEPDRAETYEDPSITDPEARRAAFLERPQRPPLRHRLRRPPGRGRLRGRGDPVPAGARRRRHPPLRPASGGSDLSLSRRPFVEFADAMRNPRDFVKPLAVGAPDPIRDIPVTPSRMIHFFDPSNEKIVGKLPDLAQKADILLGNLEDAIAVDNKDAAAPGLVKVGKEIDLGDTALWTRVNSLESPWVLDDITTLVTEIGDKLDVIMVPKVEGAVGHPLRRPAARPARGQRRPRAADPRPRDPRDRPGVVEPRGDRHRLARACRA